MPKQGLTEEKIYHAAAMLIAECGYEKFSLRELARRLKVKPASLYSHVRNIAEISENVGLRAITELSSVLDQAIQAPERREAFRQFAAAYRKFAEENPELYRAILALPKSDDPLLKERERETITPLRRLVEKFVQTPENIVQQQRFFRSALHGFLSLEMNGFMRNSHPTVEESFNMLIESCLREIQYAAQTEITARK